MFNWLGNIFPYSDLHSLNLDWILTKMKETAAQAAKAIADSANALAQVIEAKIAAQNAQTAAQNAQTAANNAQTAANNAADSAENAVTVAQQAQSAAQTAQNTANTAQSAAQTAQNTAETAQSAAQNAQNAADAAQSAAETAQTTADSINGKFPIKLKDLYGKVYFIYTRTTGGTTIGGPDADISTIGNEFSFNSSNLKMAGSHYVQPRAILTYQGATDTDFLFHFTPFFTRDLSAGVCAPFIVCNKTTKTFYKGHALITPNPSDTYRMLFQLFFESMPPFKEGTTFDITMNQIIVNPTDVKV